jgi:Ca2+-binding RTX toxin-like protein
VVYSFDLRPQPASANPLIAGLLGYQAFRSGYTITVALEAKARDNGLYGGTLWSAQGAYRAFSAAAQAWSEVANIDIRISPFNYHAGDDRSAYTWVESLSDLSTTNGATILGQHNLPGAGALGGDFNNKTPFFTSASNNRGGYGFVTFLHEIGHGLGLTHPFDGPANLPGVTSESSLGDNQFNTLASTVMSYNDQIGSIIPTSDDFGWVGTPMALDIAAIQLIYGANMTTRTGSDTYVLPSANGPGTFWSAIWDAGGIDTISAENGQSGATIDLRPATLANEPGGAGWISQIGALQGGFTIANGVTIENAFGSSFDDVVRGNAVDNSLFGVDGDDRLFGFAGNDKLYGGAGSDNLDGGDGDDQLSGGDGDNILFGGTGNDLLQANSGKNILYGDDGNDIIIVTGGDNSLFGGAGADALTGGTGNDRLDGGAGSDRMFGGTGDDIYYADSPIDETIERDGQGTDTVIASVDWVLGNYVENLTLAAARSGTGNSLANSITGSSSDNSLDGRGGNDILNGGGGVDTLHGGDGDDQLYSDIYAMPGDPYSGASVPLRDMAGDFLYGGIGADLLRGGGGNDHLDGGTGDDILDGRDGDDFIVTGGGRDRVNGGDGLDTLVLDGNASTYRAALIDGQALLAGQGSVVFLQSIERLSFSGIIQNVAPLLDGLREFNPLAYIASYSDLIQGYGTNAVAGRQHFLEHGLLEGRTITFDPLAYIASNPDLLRGYGYNEDAGARHYIEHGLAEGRTISFDPLAYIASYPDLLRGYGTNADIGMRHYIQHGFAEGRTVTFDPLAYIASYSDLAAGFGSNANAGLRHYIEHGYAEGRTVSFDALAYGAGYTDLALGLGDNVEALTRHYIEHGLGEGRSADPGFDAVAYLLSNPDLASAGIGASAALDHWLLHGVAEGRSGDVLFGREQNDHALVPSSKVQQLLDDPHDHDWFTFSGEAGENIRIDYAATAISGTVSLYHSNGQFIAESMAGPQQSVSLNYHPTQGDSYYVVVQANDNVPGGSPFVSSSYALDLYMI